MKFPHLSLHGTAGFQAWSKFKCCGSEHASSCQKDPNFSVPRPLWERLVGQGNQRLTPLLNTNQTARVEGFPLGARLSFSSIQTSFTRSQLHEPRLSLVTSLPSRREIKLCEIGGHTQTCTPFLRLPGPTRQNGPNKDAITTQEAISNDPFISNYNPSSLLPNSQTSCYTSRCCVCFLVYYKVSYHSHHSSVIFYC